MTSQTNPSNRRSSALGALALTLAVAMVAASCGSGNLEDSAPGSTAEAIGSAPSTSEAPEALEDEPSQEEAEPVDDEVESDGYLAAEDVEEYIAAFQAAQAGSFLSVNGSSEPLTEVEAGSQFLVSTPANTLTLALDDDGIVGALLENEDGEWDLASELDYRQVPVELDEESGEGDILRVVFTVASQDDPSVTAEVDLMVDLNIVGGGNSTVEVRDQYALIAGTLGTMTYTQLHDIISTQPDVDTLVFTSVAGSANDEINVHTARLIRSAGWTTWVPANGDISSGGVDMFVAGVERYVEPGGFVGVHSWAGDDGTVGSDFPRDDPAHRSQLEYFSEMLGEKVGPEFYFYTLEASPAEQIYRMDEDEVLEYGLVTGDAPGALPSELVGARDAGYLELLDGVYLKVLVDACGFDGGTGEAEAESADLGPLSISAEGGTGSVVFDGLPEGLDIHPVSEVAVANGILTAVVDVDLGDLVDGDTSEAELVMPCGG